MVNGLIFISIAASAALLHLLPESNNHSDIFLATSLLSCILALCLVVMSGLRIRRLRNYSGGRSLASMSASYKIPTLTQISIFLGILGYAVLVQFSGKGGESWFEAHAETIIDNRAGTSAQNGNRQKIDLPPASTPVADPQPVQAAAPLTVREGAEPANTTSASSPATEPASSNPLSERAEMAMQPIQPAPLPLSQKDGEGGGATVMALAAVLVLGLLAIFGYRFLQPRNNPERQPPVSRSAMRKTPTLTQIAILLVIVGYAAAANFIGAWFEAEADPAFKKRAVSDAIVRGGDSQKTAPAPEGKVARTEGQSAQKDDSGSASLPAGNTNQLVAVAELASEKSAPEKIDTALQGAAPLTAKEGVEPVSAASPDSPTAIQPAPEKLVSEKPVAAMQPIQPAVSALPSKDEQGSGFFSYAIFGLAGALVLGVLAILGYHFLQLRNRSGRNLPVLEWLPRKKRYLALAATALGVLAYAVTMQFFGKGIESWFGADIEKKAAEESARALENIRKELAKEPSLPDEKVVQQATPLKEKEKVTGVDPREDGNVLAEPAFVEPVQTKPSKPTRLSAGKALASFAGSEKMPVLSAVGNAGLMGKRMLGKVVSDKPVAPPPAEDKPVVVQEAAPLTAKENFIAFASPDNVALLEDITRESVQPVEHKRMPVYRPVASKREQRAGGRYVFNGSIGVDSDNRKTTSGDVTTNQKMFRTNFNISNAGYIWDPRFLNYNVGMTLQKETSHTSSSAGYNSNTSANVLGYNLSTIWLPGKPYALSLYGSRTQSTVSTYNSPSSTTTSTGAGASFGWSSEWLGRLRFNLNSTRSDNDSSTAPRSDTSRSFSVDASKKLFPKKWGESDVGYGYRHSEMEDLTTGNTQTQDHLYVSDGTKLGEKINLRANASSSINRSEYGAAALMPSTETTFSNFNSGLSVQQNAQLSHSYTLGLTTNDSGTSKSSSRNGSGAVNYRFNQQWYGNASLGLSSSTTDSLGSSQTNSSKYSSGGINYADKYDVYLVNAGYSLSMSRSDSSAAGAASQQTTSHSAFSGYTRTGSPRYADSLQLRMSRTINPDVTYSDANIRYSVSSTLSQKDALHGSVDFRRYNSSSSTGSDSSNFISSQMGWQHRLSDRANSTVSLGMNRVSAESGSSDYRYAQGSVTMLLQNNIQLDALVRREDYNSSSMSSNKTTLESNLNYRIGKWYTGARYRYGNAQTNAPYKEQSIFLTVRRAYGFDF